MENIDALYERVDKAFSILEELERRLGMFFQAVEECGGRVRGQAYNIYTLMVQLRDELAEIRRLASGLAVGGSREVQS
ncbi:hypothetical protein [Hyperthermus butylicus]|uniref:Uncharacterized protein n=1 Tax=Hyperthermus butylicus (strain DSM 5456 / JCM 9403 / PLM1-5) TaxID=415426 RepID=A2BLQ4_HYPBU|nr:hypothetical protein [Hyperthermus butylicus]ABM80915.1 hypothetical protein Hbut_1072 [Hyperthermus butylicus DSM 5456]